MSGSEQIEDNDNRGNQHQQHQPEKKVNDETVRSKYKQQKTALNKKHILTIDLNEEYNKD